MLEREVQNPTLHVDDLIGALDGMETTLYHLLVLFHERMRSLIRSWRSQKLDAELQIQCYAGGLMYAWYQKVRLLSCHVTHDNSNDASEQVQDSPSDISAFFGSDDDNNSVKGKTSSSLSASVANV